MRERLSETSSSRANSWLDKLMARVLNMERRRAQHKLLVLSEAKRLFREVDEEYGGRSFKQRQYLRKSLVRTMLDVLPEDVFSLKFGKVRVKRDNEFAKLMPKEERINWDESHLEAYVRGLSDKYGRKR